MGKKGKRSAKTGDGKPKQGPGKARRERAAAMKEFEASVTALIERLESETKDMELYGPLIEQEECPICFLPLPRSDPEILYMECCGKIICGGCAHAASLVSTKTKTSEPCAFCRSEILHDDEALIAQFRSRAEKNDVDAINGLAGKYEKGEDGLPKDEIMALRLHFRAAELGSLPAIVFLANRFREGEDVLVPQDTVVAMQLATIAAKKGYLKSYSLLGIIYHDLGDIENTVKVWTFAARAGHSACMEVVRTFTIDGTNAVSDDDLEAIEDAYKDAVKQEWSEEREAFKKFHRDSFN